MTATDASDRAGWALNKLCKWRVALAGRILGTTGMTPRAKGVRDVFDKLLILRVEQNALTRLCLERKLFTVEQLQVAIGEEAVVLDREYEKVFKGGRTTKEGFEIYDVKKWAETTKDWPA